MDKHEKGLEIDPDRPDLPLPKWDGRYRGDQKRLPKVVQKLVLRRPLTPEEKAELLWRFYELEQGTRARRGLLWLLFAIVVGIACFAGYFVYTNHISLLAALAPPR